MFVLICNRVAPLMFLHFGNAFRRVCYRQLVNIGLPTLNSISCTDGIFHPIARADELFNRAVHTISAVLM